MSRKGSLLSCFRTDPWGGSALALAGAGIVLVVLAGRDLLRDPSDQAARWLIYVGLAPLLAGLLMGVGVLRRGRTALALRETGLTVRARVTDVRRDWLSRGYALHYGFEDSMGRSHRGRAVLSQREAFHWRAGDAGEVRVDPRDPEIHVWVGRGFELGDDDTVSAAEPVVEAGERDDDGLVSGPVSPPSKRALLGRSKSLRTARLSFFYFLLFSLFLILLLVSQDSTSVDDRIGLALFSLLTAGVFALFVRQAWKGMREVREWRSIASRGVPVVATVVLVEEKRKRLGRWTWIPGWVVSYRYRDPSGRSHTGDSGYLSRRAAEAWRTRDRCLVLCDPERPERSLWVGRG